MKNFKYKRGFLSLSLLCFSFAYNAAEASTDLALPSDSITVSHPFFFNGGVGTKVRKWANGSDFIEENIYYGNGELASTGKILLPGNSPRDFESVNNFLKKSLNPFESFEIQSNPESHRIVWNSDTGFVEEVFFGDLPQLPETPAIPETPAGDLSSFGKLITIDNYQSITNSKYEPIIKDAVLGGHSVFIREDGGMSFYPNTLINTLQNLGH